MNQFNSNPFRLFFVLATLLALTAPTLAWGQDPCVVVDTGGTIELPPDGCEYLSPEEVHMIIDGIPGGTIEFAPIHRDFICGSGGDKNTFCVIPPPGSLCETIGGPLGGNSDCSRSTLHFQATGTGILAAFSRPISIPDVLTEIATAPRTPGDLMQSFDTEITQIDGELFGDPDFCTLRITAGRDFGLPSPGHTILTQLPGGFFNVDSFFDVEYRIEFVGCPGSVLEGFSGTTQATVRMETGVEVPPVPSATRWGLMTLAGLLVVSSATLYRFGRHHRRSE